MSDHSHPHTHAFDYDALAGHLLDRGLEASPSLLHGGVCGLLCAGETAVALPGQALH